MTWRGFLLAVAFLTRIPVRIDGEVGVADQGAALYAYPLVGLLLGAGGAVAGALLVALGVPALPAAVLVVGALAAATGALHLDGLADSADAWVGGQGDRARTLTIMKDPSCGPVGVVALVLVLAAKITAIAPLLEAGPAGWLALAVAPALARGACMLLFDQLPYVRSGGLGAEAHAAQQGRGLRIAAGITAAGAVVLTVGAALAPVLAVALVTAGGIAWMKGALGGLTGDTAGALVEVAEAAALIAAVAVLT